MFTALGEKLRSSRKTPKPVGVIFSQYPFIEEEHTSESDADEITHLPFPLLQIGLKHQKGKK